jgi:hypothetical protein
MNLVDRDFIGKPRPRALRDHFATIEEPREPGGWRIGCLCCCLSSAGRSAIASATRGSPPGARRICRCCSVSCLIVMALPVRAG